MAWFNTHVQIAFNRACRGIGLGLAFLGALSCGPANPQGERQFRLEQMRPRPSARSGVYLNETLVFHFSADIDPASVTRESLAVRTVEGSVEAAGRFEVEGNWVRFLPDLGLAQDLSDGGLKPGTRYKVELLGFPAPDGLRSAAGVPLSHGSLFHFETAALTDPPSQMFEERAPGRRSGLSLATDTMRPEQSIFLTSEEPIDPSTLVDGEFLFQPLHGARSEAVPLDPILRENSHQAGARLELRPRRRLGPGQYRMAPDLSISARDFGGNSLWIPARVSQWASVQVREAGENQEAWVESFLTSRLRSPLVVPDVDGAAHWRQDGTVTVRYPAAAGSGREGHVQWGGNEGRTDLHAISIHLADESEVVLSALPELVIVRTQGKLTLDGTLTRRSGTADGMRFERGTRLSDWLLDASRRNLGWTVLVAGGDLVVNGEIQVDGPLLLVAGGRIRVTGKVRAQNLEVWLAGSPVGAGLDPTASEALIVLDPPLDNPLVEPLTFAVLSGPMPPAGGVMRWGRAEVQGEARNGRFRVEYLPAALRPGEPKSEWGLVSSPRDLLSAPALRLLLSLTVEPADRGSRARLKWDPPVIDDVRLQWEPGNR